MRLLWASLVGAAVASDVGSNMVGIPPGDRVIRVYPENVESLSESTVTEIQNMLGEIDVWGTSEDGGMEMLVRENQLANMSLLQSLFRVEDSTEYHQNHFQWMKENYESQVCTDAPEVCAGTDAKSTSRQLLQGADFYTRYQRLAAIHERINWLASTHATVSIMSWGRSLEGREQRGVRVSQDATNRPIIFWFCGEHAREWLPPMFCTYMAETLATRFASGDATVRNLMSRFEFHILPVMNPDGYEWSHTNNNMWRKSRRPNTNHNSNCIGTDLNRNYAFQWNTGGSSNDPCSDTYHGGNCANACGAFNNVETANLRTYMASVGTRVRVQVDCHAYGNMWMHPWGYTTALPTAEPAMRSNGAAAVAAIRGVNGLNFAMGSIARVIYVASGSSCDWFYGTHGVVQAWAPEVRGTSFQPPATNIGPSNNELWAGMISQATNA